MEPPATEPPIIVYGRRMCGGCDALMNYLRSTPLVEGVDFIEQFVAWKAKTITPDEPPVKSRAGLLESSYIRSLLPKDPEHEAFMSMAVGLSTSRLDNTTPKHTDLALPVLYSWGRYYIYDEMFLDGQLNTHAIDQMVKLATKAASTPDGQVKTPAHA